MTTIQELIEAGEKALDELMEDVWVELDLTLPENEPRYKERRGREIKERSLRESAIETAIKALHQENKRVREALERIQRQKSRYTDTPFGDKELADLGAAVYDIMRSLEQQALKGGSDDL